MEDGRHLESEEDEGREMMMGFTHSSFLTDGHDDGEWGWLG